MEPTLGESAASFTRRVPLSARAGYIGYRNESESISSNVMEPTVKSRSMTTPYSEMGILRRVVDPDQPFLSPDAARAILRLNFSVADRRRMAQLASKNRSGTLKPVEEMELDNFIRVGQTLGILQSKARRSLRATRTTKSPQS